MPTDPNELLAGFFNGTLDADQLEALERWVAEDPAHADALARYAIDQRAIEHMLRLDRMVDLSATPMDEPASGRNEPDESEWVVVDAPDDSSAMAFIIEQALADRRRHELEDEANRRLAAQQAEEARIRRLELRRRKTSEPVDRDIVIPKAIVWLGLAAVLGFAVTMFTHFNSDPTAKVTPQVVERVPQPEAQTTSPVAHLVDSFDAVWADPMPPGTQSLSPGQYTLTHGWAEIRTMYGVDLVLEAPVTIALAEDNGIELMHGQLVADVSERAVGFTVRVPRGRVVDYGTRFGVSVSRGGESIAHVFQGEVEVNSGSGTPGATIRLVENEAAMIRESGQIFRGPAQPEFFAQEVPDTAYQAAVMVSRPMCYWRGPINSETMILANHGWLAADAKATGSLRHHTSGFASSDPSGALDFGRSDNAAVAIEPNKRFVLQRSFTVEAWCWIAPRHEGFMRIVSTRSESGGFGLGVNGRVGDDRIDSAPANSLVFTFFQDADYIGDVVLPESCWIHLAAVIDADGQVALFVNGSAIDVRKSTHNASSTRPAPEANLMIGRNPFTAQGIQAWRGLLDEVAIYNRALSPDEIEQHYSALYSP